MDNMIPSEYSMLYPESMKDAWIRGTLAQNMNKDFVQRIMSQNRNVSNNIKNPNGSRSNLLMATGDRSAFPTIENINGSLTPLPRFAVPKEEIQFSSPDKAAIFGMEYKRANKEGFGYY